MRRPLMIVLALVGTLGFFGVGILGWGDLAGFLENPARLGLVLITLLFVLLSLLTDASLSSGKREDVRNRWIFLPLLLVGVAFGYLPPYADRHDWLVLDGEPVRYLGLALYSLGGALRLWAMFALGRRFSGLVAIQDDHQLKTDGLYGYIRHPSYLGAILAMMGWTLVFRSALVLVLTPLLVGLVIARIRAEERLLESQFGSTYSSYRQRTWRLIPFLY